MTDSQIVYSPQPTVGLRAAPGCRVDADGRRTPSRLPPSGVVVLSMSDVPLGFGVAAKSTAECRKLEPQGIVALHQADIGEYLRDEDALC